MFGNVVVWFDIWIKVFVWEFKNKDGVDKFFDLCGLLLFIYLFSVKFFWFICNDFKIKENYEEGWIVFGIIDFWFIYCFNGGVDCEGGLIFVIDLINVSWMMFMNLCILKYDDIFLNFFGIDCFKIDFLKIVFLLYFIEFGKFICGIFKDVFIVGCLGD